MKNPFEETINKYKEFLDKELEDENLKTRLISGLEDILKKEKINKEENILLDKLIDYDEISKCIVEKGGDVRPKLLVRIQNCLGGQGIKTYGDLQIECYDNFESINGGAKTWKDKGAYERYLSNIRNFGTKSAEILFYHLEQINFDFSRESAKETYKKKQETSVNISPNSFLTF